MSSEKPDPSIVGVEDASSRSQSKEELESGQRAHGQLDEAADFLAIHQDIAKDITESEMKKVLRKVDIRLMPMLLITITIAAVDKIIISNAALYGMKTDLHLDGQLYSWTGSIFYFGYLVAEYPANILIQKFPVGKLLGITCIVWSCLTTLMAATYSSGSMMFLRFLMGAFEAPIFPCCAVITVMWYKKTEQPIRTAIVFSGFSSLVTGVVSYGIGHTSTAVAPWRLLFIVLGGFTVLWSIFITIFLPDSPVKAKFLTERERVAAVLRIKENMTGTENRKIKWYQVKEALTDWKTWPLVILIICINVANGGLVTFAAQIVSGLGYSPLNTTLLGMPTGVMMTAGGLFISIPAAYFKNIRCLLAGFAILVPITCCVLMMKLPKSNQTGLLVAYYFFYFYWSGFVAATSLSFANTAGHTKKTTVNALNFIAYCVANIIAPQFFIASEAPGYKTGYNAILGFLAVGVFMIIFYAVGILWENKRREKVIEDLKQSGVDIEVAREAEMLDDKTDKEKIFFKYSY